MTEIQNQDDAPQAAENAAVDSTPQVPSTQEPAPVAEEKKQERLVESSLESSLSNVLPLSPIETEKKPAAEQNPRKGNGRHGLRRGNAGRNGNRDGKNAQGSNLGVVENPSEAKETLSGKFVDGYEKDADFRRARERRENAQNAEKSKPAAQGWCLTGSDDPHCRHPQSNTNSARGKLIIEPVPIPDQEKDPSVWQKLKAKILSIFGLDKKKKHDKKRKGGKFRHGKNGKKFYDKGGDFRRNDGNGGNRDFRGNGNRRRRQRRGRGNNNSGTRPQNNGGNKPSAA